MVQQDLQGLGNQEPDRMNQLPSKNLRQHDDINIAGKSSTGKKKQNSGKPDAKKESQKWRWLHEVDRLLMIVLFIEKAKKIPATMGEDSCDITNSHRVSHKVPREKMSLAARSCHPATN